MHRRGISSKTSARLPGAGFSYAPVIANNGLITGWVSPPAGPRHAVLWNNGVMVRDIGAQLPAGLNSEAFGVNEIGQVAFQAETSDPDPNGEDFCGFTVLLGSSPSCLSVQVRTRLMFVVLSDGKTV